MRRNVVIPLCLLNIASTYYTKEEDEKPKFLMDNIKHHAIFVTDIKFWEACIMYKNLNLKSSQEGTVMKTSQFQESISQNVLSIAFHMNDIFKDKRIIRDVSNKYLNLYKLGDKASAVTSYLTKIEKDSHK